ncbi:GNAT family protein [Devosia sp.]|uniref:GNAT family N-acetyltransferase n=1 Tax=Devosia sp. TaxID=1871048 RepID=UPI003266934C
MTSLKLPINTDLLTLRPFKRSDAEAVASYICLADAQRYVDGVMRNKRDVAAAVAAMCEQVNLQRPGDIFTLAIVKAGEEAVIGHVSLRWSDATAGQGELTFILHPRYVGQGLATQAITSVLDIAFDHFHIHRVFARCDGRNHHSAKLFEKMGMRLEAHYREHALFQGEWDEELHFAILDREWRPSSKVHQIPRQNRVA